MPCTSYCKKCGRDVPVSDRCPDCGSKLAANTVRLTWCVDHTPVKDWICWNAVMRLVLPVMGLVLLITLLAESLLGGVTGVMAILGGVAFCMGVVLMLLLALMLLTFILQGDDLLDCVIDAKGIHVQQYLSDPTPLKLMLRGCPPSMRSGLADDSFLLIRQREIAWKDVRRVQLWPDQCMILLYGSPVWWMRLSLPCTPFTWGDSLAFIREKLGRKKNLILPPECRASASPAPAARAKPARKTQQLSMEDLPPQPIPEEEVPPEWHDAPPEQPADFTPLQDVLDEIQKEEHT